jgi:hypothetical protein
MARASTPTLLSLDDFADTLGINPAHFNGAYAGDVAFPKCGDCHDFWSQYAWQCNTGLSRDRLAKVIAEAEQTVSNWLLRPLMPTMRTKTFRYQGYANCSGYGRPGYYIGDHIEGYKPYVWVQAAEVSTDDQSIVYYDEDNDDFAETAVITFTSETVLSTCDLGLFYAGHFGESTWRITPLKRASVTWNAQDEVWDVELAVESYKLIDPLHWESLPSKQNTIGCCMRAIDMMTVDDVFVAELVVGRLSQSVDFPLVEYIHEKASGCCSNPNCLACTANKTYGCYNDQTRMDGIVVPTPGTFDEETESWCEAQSFSSCTSTPVMVRINYWVGCTDDYVENDLCGECLNPALKQIIAYLAMARLTMGSCECDCNAGMQWLGLGEDLSKNTGAGRYFSFGTLDNPFGLLRGEVMAWQRMRAYLGTKVNVSYGGY